MKNAKVKLNNSIRIKTYTVVSRAIDEGIEYGWGRAHKHTDKPDEQAIKQAIYEAVTNSLSEVINWGND